MIETGTAPSEAAVGRAPFARLVQIEPRAYAPAEEADRALRRVLGRSALDAVRALRFGPGATCEPAARVVEKAVARARAAGAAPQTWILADGAAVAGESVVRENRKLGRGTWFERPTARIRVELEPPGVWESAGGPSEAAPLMTVDTNVPGHAADGSPPSVHTAESSGARSVREALYEVLDPDLGVNVVDLGFIRRIDLGTDGYAELAMTLTSPACPLTAIIEAQIRTVLVESAEVVPGFRVHWSWHPAWTPSDISADGRAQLRAVGFTGF